MDKRSSPNQLNFSKPNRAVAIGMTALAFGLANVGRAEALPAEAAEVASKEYETPWHAMEDVLNGLASPEGRNNNKILNVAVSFQVEENKASINKKSGHVEFGTHIHSEPIDNGGELIFGGIENGVDKTKWLGMNPRYIKYKNPKTKKDEGWLIFTHWDQYNQPSSKKKNLGYGPALDFISTVFVKLSDMPPGTQFYVSPKNYLTGGLLRAKVNKREFIVPPDPAKPQFTEAQFLNTFTPARVNSYKTSLGLKPVSSHKFDHLK